MAARWASRLGFLGGLVLAALMTFMGWLSLGEAERNRGFRERAVETIAQLRSVRDCQRDAYFGTSSCLISAVFVTEDGRTIEVERRADPDQIRYVGESGVSLTYDTADPSSVRLVRPTWRSEPVPAYIFFVAGAVILVGVVALRVREGRPKPFRDAPMKPGRPGWNLLPDPNDRGSG